MGNVSPFLGLSGATAPQPMSYAGTPGPGAAPSPWKQSGSTVFYDDGGVVVPSNVPGGAKGAGSFNTEALFVNGVPVALAGGEVVQLNPGVGIVLTPNPILTVGTIALANTAVTPGGYGDSTHVGGFTVDAQGRLTAASSTLIAFPPTPTTLPPSGPAGGALSGTYPNPTLVGGPLSNYLLLSGGTLTGPLTGTTASFQTNVAGVSTVGAFGNSNTGATASSTIQQSAGTRFVNRTVDYTNQYLIENAAGLPTRYSDFDTHNFRTNAGVGYAVLNSAGLTTSGGSFSAPVAMTTATLSSTIPPTSNDTTVPTTAWVKANAGGGASITVSDTAPGSPTAGALWWNSVLGALFLYYNDGNSSQWVPAAPAASSVAVPPGAIMDFAGVNPPTGWLLCNGASYATATYPALQAAIGYLYGGSGANFNVPDLGGRVTAGKEATATRLTTGVSGVDGATLGAVGGHQAMQSHAHTLNGTFYPTTGGNLGSPGSFNWAGYSTDAAGAGNAQNVQPTIIMNKIIKT